MRLIRAGFAGASVVGLTFCLAICLSPTFAQSVVHVKMVAFSWLHASALSYLFLPKR